LFISIYPVAFFIILAFLFGERRAEFGGRELRWVDGWMDTWLCYLFVLGWEWEREGPGVWILGRDK